MGLQAAKQVCISSIPPTANITTSTNKSSGDHLSKPVPIHLGINPRTIRYCHRVATPQTLGTTSQNTRTSGADLKLYRTESVPAETGRMAHTDRAHGRTLAATDRRLTTNQRYREHGYELRHELHRTSVERRASRRDPCDPRQSAGQALGLTNARAPFAAIVAQLEQEAQAALARLRRLEDQ